MHNLVYPEKVKFTIEPAMKGQRESRYTDLLFCFTSTIDGVVGQRHGPVLLTTGKIITGGWVGHSAGLDVCGKLAPLEFDSRTLQSIRSRYTN